MALHFFLFQIPFIKPPDTLTFREIWHLWCNGEATSDYVMWGYKLRWWGRFGMTLQVVTTYTLLVDIIGVEKVKIFSESLMNSFTVKKALNRYVGVFHWCVDFIKIGEEHLKSKSVTLNYFVAVGLGSILAFGLGYWTIFYSKISFQNIKLSPEVFLIGFLFLLITSFLWLRIIWAFALLLLTFVVYVLGLIVDFIFVDTIAWILSRKGMEKQIKIVAIILIFVGFFLDILNN
jgi:hypothetical protein